MVDFRRGGDGRREVSSDRGRGGDDRGSDRGRDSGRDDRSDRGRDDRGRDRGDDRGGRGGRDSGRGGSGSSAGYSYQKRTVEQTQHRATMGANDFDKILKDGVKMWTPQKGKNRIRFLPPTFAVPEGKKSHDHYGLDIFVHYGVGPDRGSYLDLEKMLGQPDPISEERAALVREGRADDKELKDLDSKRRVLCYLVDRDEESEGVQAWACPWTLDKDIYMLSVDSESNALINIDDPEEGYDVEFTKEGEKDRTKYVGVSIARRSSRLGRAEWLDHAIDHPLDKQLNYFSYDDIAKAFGGGGAVRDERSGSDRDGRSQDRGDARGRDDRDRSSDRRDEPAGRGDRGVGGRGRDDSRDRVEDAPLNWMQVHTMTSAELDALVASDDRLNKINPQEAETDAQLANWICEDLGIKEDAPDVPPSRRGGRSDPLPDNEATTRLAAMREQRGRR